MTPEELGFLKQFFQNLREQPLEPDDPRYVHIYRDRRLAPSDPVELLARAIEWTPGESVQLFSGFRGAGKSTELRRLPASRCSIRQFGSRVARAVRLPVK